MEYEIDKERLNKLVSDYIDNYFRNQEINYSHPYDQYRDEWGDEVEGENPYVIEYFIGDYYEEDLLFRLYFKEYWTGTNSTADKRRSQSPLVTILNQEFEESLNTMFNDVMFWEDGFKMWFNEKFDLKINRVR